MPYIRINSSQDAFTTEQKQQLAALLVEAVMSQETDPVTDIGRKSTPVMFNEIETCNSFPGGQPFDGKPFWVVEAIVAAAFFNQARRDALQESVAKAFIQIYGHDGTSIDREGVKISPSWLTRLHTLIVEIPEGSWGNSGQTVDIEKMARLLGGTQGPKRLMEARENAAKLKAARVS
jgi:phenylpyruvate tautomerase PptA (4-oxalocrotonate tautomerase family)